MKRSHDIHDLYREKSGPRGLLCIHRYNVDEYSSLDLTITNLAEEQYIHDGYICMEISLVLG